jgi:spermidine synthase
MAGLIYEVVWVRLLTLVFGTTTFAVATVLSAFMAGLAIGSRLLGHFVDNVRSPLLVYGLLELGIACYAIFIPGLIEMLNAAYTSTLAVGATGNLAHAMVRFGFALGVLLVPTILMGGTLPVLSRFFIRSAGTAGSDVALLYAINTLGAVSGVLVGGFWLEPAYGVRTSIHIAATVNGLIGIIAMLLALANSDQRAQPTTPTLATERVPVGFNIFLLVGAISGFCALGYEVLWFRTLLLAVLNDTYAFSIMLAVFLTGLTLGSWLASRFLRRERNWPGILAGVMAAIGIISAISLPLFIVFHNAMFLPLRGQLATSFQSVALSGALLAGGLMFLPTLLMGFALPVINRLYMDDTRMAGRRIGTLYAVNTFGAVLGSAVTGFVLVPAIGIIRSAIVLAALNVLAGYVISRHRRAGLPNSPAWLPVTIAAVGAGMLGFVALASNPAALRIQMMPGTDTLFYREGASSIVTVVEKGNMRAAFVNGNIVVGSTPGALQTVRLLAHLPVLLHPAPKSAAIVGFGMGVTSHAVALHPLARIDIVEIAPEVIEAADWFKRLNGGVLDDPRVALHIEDGRNYLLRTTHRYDLITADPTHPVLGSGNLYTQEYYRQCFERLAPDGVIAQYVPMHLLGNAEFRTLIGTFASVFDQSSLWYTQSDLVIVGTKQAFSIPYGRISGMLSESAIRKDLAQSGLDNANQLLGHLLLGPDEIRQFAATAETNTDDHPVIEFRGSRTMGADTRATNIDSLIPYLAPIEKYVAVEDESATARAALLGDLQVQGEVRAHIVKGLASDYRGDLAGAAREYTAALALRGGDTDAQRLLHSAEIRLRPRTGSRQ